MQACRLCCWQVLPSLEQREAIRSFFLRLTHGAPEQGLHSFRVASSEACLQSHIQPHTGSVTHSAPLQGWWGSRGCCPVPQIRASGCWRCGRAQSASWWCPCCRGPSTSPCSSSPPSCRTTSRCARLCVAACHFADPSFSTVWGYRLQAVSCTLPAASRVSLWRCIGSKHCSEACVVFNCNVRDCWLRRAASRYRLQFMPWHMMP